MRDLEKFPDYDYMRLEYGSQGFRMAWSRSPSPPRTPIYRFRRKSPYIKIAVILIASIFTLSVLECVCDRPSTVQSLVPTIGEWFSSSQNQSPFTHQSPSAWTPDETESDGEYLPEAWARKQEDDAGIRTVKQAIQETVNNTVIFIPSRSTDMQWVDNLNCRFSQLNISNVVYWAMDHDAALQLQSKGVAFYYN